MLGVIFILGEFIKIFHRCQFVMIVFLILKYLDCVFY